MSAPPRALVVDLSTRFGGADARVLGLLEAMPAGTAALAVLRDAPVRAAARERGIETLVVGASKADPRIPLRLVRLLRTRRFAVVDTQNPQSRLWGSLAARAAGAALVSTLNSWYEAEHEGRAKGRLYQALERRLPRPDRFVVVAPDIAAHLRADGVPASAVALVPNAAAVDPAAVPADPARLRAELGLSPAACVAVAVGRLVEAKGYDVLVDAVARLADEHPALHVALVGEGHLRSALERRIAGRGVAGRVHLVGFRPPAEVARLVRSADLFLMPSRTEGTPVALLEAAALGRPIVASSVGGIPGIVTDGAEALLVPPGDPAALARAVADLLGDPAWAAALGAAAAARVGRDFSRPAQVAATLRTWDEAADRRRRTRSRG